MQRDEPIGNCRPCDFIAHRFVSVSAHMNSTNDGAKHEHPTVQQKSI